MYWKFSQWKYWRSNLSVRAWRAIWTFQCDFCTSVCQKIKWQDCFLQSWQTSKRNYLKLHHKTDPSPLCCGRIDFKWRWFHSVCSRPLTRPPSPSVWVVWSSLCRHWAALLNSRIDGSTRRVRMSVKRREIMEAKRRENGGSVVGTWCHFAVLHNDTGLSRHKEHTHKQ